MSVSVKQYQKMTEKASPSSPSFSNCLKAFLIGGLICCIGQGLVNFWTGVVKLSLDDARAATSIILILLAATLTALGWFSPIARHAGAGTLVPITGFANSIVAPAIEFKSEGQVFGIGARMFTIAGPVLVFGMSASFIFGIILWLCGLIWG